MNPPAPEAPSFSGKKLIVVIFGIATAMAGFGWWWKFQEAARPRELWGVAHALRIRDSERVEVLHLVSQPDLAPSPVNGIPQESFLIGGHWFAVIESIDASRVLGVNDFRRVLLADWGYDWDADLSACQPKWEFALRFSSKKGEQTTLLYARNCQRMYLLESGAEEAVVPPMASFAESFFERALKLEPAKSNEKP